MHKALGIAPKWCTFLDNITEELEEKPADTGKNDCSVYRKQCSCVSYLISVYDDYKFLTLKELETLGLSHLIGSDLLRAYMHGYFMDIRLYNQVQYSCVVFLQLT
jgi:ribosome biogenesis protein ENP2